MSDHQTRIVQCFALAKIVNHYYWIHTSADGEDGSVSVENLQKIIGLMVGITISKRLLKAESRYFRGWVERSADHALITIVAEQELAWQRFTHVKELSQILFDDEEEFEPDPLVMLKDLTSDVSFGLSDDLTPAMQSERLAEALALELLYPLEYRRDDKAFLEAGGDIKELVEKRKVPAVHMRRTHSESYLESSEEAWRALRHISQLPPLLKK